MTLKVNDFYTFPKKISFPEQNILKKLAFTVLNTEKVNSPVNLIFCDDLLVYKLNLSFRGFNKPTDVLSFPYQEPVLWGEIYISLETSERQAFKFKHSLLDELKKLTVHGCLHLTGWEHQTDAEESAMKKRELFFLRD